MPGFSPSCLWIVLKYSAFNKTILHLDTVLGRISVKLFAGKCTFWIPLREFDDCLSLKYNLLYINYNYT